MRQKMPTITESAAGGLDKRRTYQVPRPPNRRRLTPTALTALQAYRPEPHGFAGSAQRRVWLAEQPQVHWSSAGV